MIMTIVGAILGVLSSLRKVQDIRRGGAGGFIFTYPQGALFNGLSGGPRVFNPIDRGEFF